MTANNEELVQLAQAVIDEIDALVDESDGVYGLHLNGDVAPWGEILTGGRFERLTSVEALREALRSQAGAVPCGWHVLIAEAEDLIPRISEDEPTAWVLAEWLAKARAWRVSEGVFIQQKPTHPGAYWLKGHILNHPEKTDLVRLEFLDGELCQVDPDSPHEWSGSISMYRDDFLWSGPLLAAPPSPAADERVRDGWKQECADTDSLPLKLGVPVEQSRSEGGRLRILHVYQLVHQHLHEAMDAVKRAANVDKALPSAEAGSSTCPLCGWDRPHQHTPQEIIIYGNGRKAGMRAALAARKADVSLVDEGNKGQVVDSSDCPHSALDTECDCFSKAASKPEGWDEAQATARRLHADNGSEG